MDRFPARLPENLPIDVHRRPQFIRLLDLEEKSVDRHSDGVIIHLSLDATGANEWA